VEHINQVEQFIQEIIKSQNLAFLGSVDANGFPAVRAMLRPRKYDDIRDMWFTTHSPSDKVKHFEDNPKACVYFCDPARFHGILLRGEIKVYDAVAAERQLSNIGDALYYPKIEFANGYMALNFMSISGRLYQQHHSEDFFI
jgi:general stress protein 26